MAVGQNYNLAKKENAKVPHVSNATLCVPLEKEEAIKVALEYFKMI